jgi:hypothetical protein
MLYLLIIALIALALMSYQDVTDYSTIKVSKYSKQLQHDVVLALFKTMQHLERVHDEDIQHLINMNVLNKIKIEEQAEQLLFTWGEFPGEKLDLDARDFSHLVNVYSEFVRGTDDDYIKHLINTLYH